MFSLTWILWTVLVGLLFGSIGRALAPGKQDISLVWTILVGIAASFLGGVVASILPFSGWLFEFLVRVVLAVIGVTWVANRYGTRKRVH